jgi:hypothetical protein
MRLLQRHPLTLPCQGCAEQSSLQALRELDPAAAAEGLTLPLDRQHHHQQPLIWGSVYEDRDRGKDRKGGRDRERDRDGVRDTEHDISRGSRKMPQNVARKILAYLVLVSLSLAGTMKKKGEYSCGLNTIPIVPRMTTLEISYPSMTCHTLPSENITAWEHICMFGEHIS